MKRFNVMLSCAATAAGVALSGSAGAITVPDTGTCSATGDCFKITDTNNEGVAIVGNGSSVQGTGVLASGFIGVYGTTTSGTAIVAQASSGTGISGGSTTGNGVVGSTGGTSKYGVYGNATGASSSGVYGHSTQYDGVYGTTDASLFYGVYGTSTVGIAIRGDGNTRGVHGAASAVGGIGVSGNAPTGVNSKFVRDHRFIA